jgi:hypothetical protein
MMQIIEIIMGGKYRRMTDWWLKRGNGECTERRRE